MPKAKTVVEFFLQWRDGYGHWYDVTYGSIFNDFILTWRNQYQARRKAVKLRSEHAYCRNEKSKPKKFRIVKKTTTTEIVEQVKE
jgi:hypothetical protein